MTAPSSFGSLAGDGVYGDATSPHRIGVDVLSRVSAIRADERALVRCDDDDSRQLAVELAQAHDALSALRAQFQALLAEKEELLSQLRPHAMPAAAAGAGMVSARVVGAEGSGGPNPFDTQGGATEEHVPRMASNPFGGDGDDLFAAGSAVPRGESRASSAREGEESRGGQDLCAYAGGRDVVGSVTAAASVGSVTAAAASCGVSASHRDEDDGSKGEPNGAVLRAARARKTWIGPG